MPAGTKLAVSVLVIGGTIAYMAYVGAANSWQYYLTVDECLADSEQFNDCQVRISGKVAKESLQISEERMLANFELQGQKGKLAVACRGPLPDNLAESMGVVVEGWYRGAGHLQGERVFTRCASKYDTESKKPRLTPSHVPASGQERAE